MNDAAECNQNGCDTKATLPPSLLNSFRCSVIKKTYSFSSFAELPICKHLSLTELQPNKKHRATISEEIPPNMSYT